MNGPNEIKTIFFNFQSSTDIYEKGDVSHQILRKIDENLLKSDRFKMVRVVFLHPDLGIGGAERLVVDAALALRDKSHDVHIVTCHHDESHCFEETRNGSLQVTSVGDWLPR